MNRERFSHLKNEVSYQLYDTGRVTMKFQGLTVYFDFRHQGLIWEEGPGRIKVKAVSEDTTEADLYSRQFLQTELLLVNADIYDYAFTFAVTADFKNKLVAVALADEPEKAKSDVTQQERFYITSFDSGSFPSTLL